ncbi:radical SAM protein [soil metagenome]
MLLLAHSYFLSADAKQLARMKPYPPLATMLVAGLLRDNGHALRIFDAMLASGVDAFRAELAAYRPTLVGILEDNFNFLTKMCTMRMREATLAMIAAARQQGCRVVVNGSDSADHPQLYLDAGADAVIFGEAEMTMLEIADIVRADAAASLSHVAGVAIRDASGAVTRFTSRAAMRDLDLLPLPAWDLVDVNAYRHAWTTAHGRFSWNIVSSRGCPFGCNWCAKPVFGRRYSQRSPECVGEEMRRLKVEVQPDHLWFCDDIFGLTAQWIVRFAGAVRARHARIPFMIQCRADLITAEVARALSDAGAEEVGLGVESGSQRILDAMEKGTAVDDVRQATRLLKQRGVRACWFLQLGYPGETWDDLRKTRALLHDEWPDDIGVSVAYPLPGTKFYEAVKEQLGARHNWEDTSELAMLFQGTYTTAFYRRIRDLFHDEVRSRIPDARPEVSLYAHRRTGPCIHATAWPAARRVALGHRTDHCRRRYRERAGHPVSLSARISRVAAGVRGAGGLEPFFARRSR